MGKPITLSLNNVDVNIGSTRIIKNISFDLCFGEICALVGHNGAGKTITLKSIMGIHEKSKGTIKINNTDIDEDYLNYKTMYSYIPEEPILFTELTVYQHFQLYGTSYKVPEKTFQERVEYYVDGFEMNGKLDEFPEDLSKGMRQKVNIISNLITDTPLLIIDEPFIGLDENSVLFLEQEIINKASNGTSILITSHLIERVKKLCHSFIMLKEGEVVNQGKIEDLRSIESRT